MTPTGRIANTKPEIQDLNWGRRRFTTVPGHVAAMLAMNLAPLELRMMAHELDEYLTFARTCGLGEDEANKILDEEQAKAQRVFERINFFEKARNRIMRQR